IDAARIFRVNETFLPQFRLKLYQRAMDLKFTVRRHRTITRSMLPVVSAFRKGNCGWEVPGRVQETRNLTMLLHVFLVVPALAKLLTKLRKIILHESTKPAVK